MKDFTIIIIAHNEQAHVDLSIQSIRMFADVESLSVVVVDNHSTDNLKDWASTQEDITYIYVDDRKESYSKLLNQVIEILELKGDILVLGAHYMLTPGTLSRLQSVLHTHENIGAVGPMSNGFENYQKIHNIDTFEKAVLVSGTLKSLTTKPVISLSQDAVLFKCETINKIGIFNEELSETNSIMTDFYLRLLQADLQLQVCQTAILWDTNIKPNTGIHNNQDAQILKRQWGMNYFNAMYNENLIAQIKENEDATFHVLEIGCDCGATLFEIKNRYPNACVYGSELNPNAAQIASHFATISVNNIEDQNLEYADNTFDYIILGDILEHLHDPLDTIEYCRNLLKNSGCIIASIPNVMHISVVEDLLRGNFTYTDVGLLDKTHIHLFTFNEIAKMFMSCNYEIEQLTPSISPISQAQSLLIDKLLELTNGAQRFMYEAFQYIICARKLD